jgi:predicted alpha/beta superfamily hydrolase
MLKTLGLLFAFTLTFDCIADEDNSVSLEINSSALNEKRPVLIRLPVDYANNKLKKYPVLFILNDDTRFNWASSIVDVQASRYGIEDMIVVGLPHIGDYGGDNYPFKEKGSLELSLQAQNYSRFIREEALPYIDQNYRTNGGRFIIGHSLSGLFVTHMFIQHPNVFSTYVVLSPSIHHAPQISSVVKSHLQNNKNLTGSIYISLGDMEHQQIQKEYKLLEKVFYKYAPDQLNWVVNYMVNTDHILAGFKGTYEALSWIYADWYIQDTKMQTTSVNDYIEHYKKLSKRLKYDIKPRERHMSGFSWFAKNKLNDLNAAENALKTAIHFYPESKDLKERLTKLAE